MYEPKKFGNVRMAWCSCIVLTICYRWNYPSLDMNPILTWIDIHLCGHSWFDFSGFHHQYTQCWTQSQDVATLKGLPDVNGEWLASTLTGNIGKHQTFSSHMEDAPFFHPFSIVWYATRDSIVCIILFQEIGVSHLHMSGHAQGDFFLYLGQSPTDYLLGEYMFTVSSRIIQKQLQEFHRFI